MSRLRIHHLHSRNRRAKAIGIAALEARAEYPLGNDFFHIDHGQNYFAFFERLGRIKFYVAEIQGQVVAVGAGILRVIKTKSHPNGLRSWYLCDLKVAPEFRGRHIPLRLLGRAFLPNYLRCRRGYAISMNNPGAPDNKVARLLGRFPWARISPATQLDFYAFSATDMETLRPRLEHHLGPISFLALDPQKKLIMRSNGKPLPLLHVQHGPMGEQGLHAPQDGHIHMFCTPCDSPLALELTSMNIERSATATVIQHRMQNFDWGFILTSDI